MNNTLDKNLNIAGKLSLAFINHPLTLIFGIFILILGYVSLIGYAKKEPQIKVSGGVVIVALLEHSKWNTKSNNWTTWKKNKRDKGVENIYSYAKDSVELYKFNTILENKEESNLKLYDQVMRNMDLMPQGAIQPIIKTMDIDTDIPIATIAFYSQKKMVKI